MTLSQELLEQLAQDASQEGLNDAFFTEFLSPVGKLIVVQSNSGICRVAFDDERKDEVLGQVARVIGPRILWSRELTRAVAQDLEAYFAGEVQDLDVPVDLALVGSEFRRRVLHGLRNVGPGTVATYGRLADAVGAPRAARAVGTACARNPIPIVLPCHRVVPSSGGVGAYIGGCAKKRWLLEFEGAL